MKLEQRPLIKPASHPLKSILDNTYTTVWKTRIQWISLSEAFLSQEKVSLHIINFHPNRSSLGDLFDNIFLFQNLFSRGLQKENLN
jgi:hypothetical protein